MIIFKKTPAAAQTERVPLLPDLPAVEFAVETAANRSRRTDTDGALRRARQTADENRLL